jgi:hypothetical protein
LINILPSDGIQWRLAVDFEGVRRGTFLKSKLFVPSTRRNWGLGARAGFINKCLGSGGTGGGPGLGGNFFFFLEDMELRVDAITEGEGEIVTSVLAMICTDSRDILSTGS